MNRREELNTLLESALADLDKTTVAELKNIQKLGYTGRTGETEASWRRYQFLSEDLEKFEDYKKAKQREKEAERLVIELRDKYLPKLRKEDAERNNEIHDFYNELYWKIETAIVRKQQINRSKEIKSKKRIEK